MIEHEDDPPLDSCTDSTTDSLTNDGGHSNSDSNSNCDLLLLEKDTRNTDTNTHQEGCGGSKVLSTASEFGTVIDIGKQSAHLAKIDAMVLALIKASPNVEALPFMQEPSPSTSSINNELMLP
jgi:hypothetical protein